jgi:hypothetical protein
VLSTDWRPDPGKGVFETLLVVGGKPIEVETHLQRMERSLNELYDLELPTEADEQVGAVAAELELGRLRLTATPILAIEAEEISPEIVFPTRGVSLFPVGWAPTSSSTAPRRSAAPPPAKPAPFSSMKARY